jgi:hypothetical protein
MKASASSSALTKLFRLPPEHQEFLLKCLILGLIYVLGMCCAGVVLVVIEEITLEIPSYYEKQSYSYYFNP